MRFHASALAVLGLSAVLSHAPSAWKLPDSEEAAEVENLDRDLKATVFGQNWSGLVLSPRRRSTRGPPQRGHRFGSLRGVDLSARRRPHWAQEWMFILPSSVEANLGPTSDTTAT